MFCSPCNSKRASHYKADRGAVTREIPTAAEDQLAPLPEGKLQGIETRTSMPFLSVSPEEAKTKIKLDLPHSCQRILPRGYQTVTADLERFLHKTRQAAPQPPTQHQKAILVSLRAPRAPPGRPTSPGQPCPASIPQWELPSPLPPMHPGWRSTPGPTVQALVKASSASTMLTRAAGPRRSHMDTAVTALLLSVHGMTQSSSTGAPAPPSVRKLSQSTITYSHLTCHLYLSSFLRTLCLYINFSLQ